MKPGPAGVQGLVDEFADITAQMDELKAQCKELAGRRCQIVVQLTDMGLYLHQIGRMVGLSAPTLCRLAQRAKKNEREEHAARDGHPGPV